MLKQLKSEVLGLQWQRLVCKPAAESSNLRHRTALKLQAARIAETAQN